MAEQVWCTTHCATPPNSSCESIYQTGHQCVSWSTRQDTSVWVDLPDRTPVCESIYQTGHQCVSRSTRQDTSVWVDLPDRTPVSPSELFECHLILLDYLLVQFVSELSWWMGLLLYHQVEQLVLFGAEQRPQLHLQGAQWIHVMWLASHLQQINKLLQYVETLVVPLSIM